jgi:hypothetical protein
MDTDATSEDRSELEACHTDAGSRFSQVASVASTARRTELSFAAAVEDTDRSSGQQKV